MSKLPTSMKLYFPYVRGHTRWLGASLALACIQVASLIPIPFLVESLFRTLSIGGDLQMLFLMLGLIFFLVVVSALSAIINRRMTLSFVKEAVGELRGDLAERVLFCSCAEYEKQSIDTAHTDIVYGTERVDCMISALLTQVVPGALIGLGIGIALVYLNPLLTAVVFLSLPIVYVIARTIGARVQVLVRKFHEDFSHFSEKISFIIHFHELIKMSGAETYEADRQRQAVQNLRFSSGKMALLSTVYTIVQGNAMVLIGLVVLLVGGTQIISGDTTLGIVLAFYIALNVLISHVRIAVGALPILVEGWESARALLVFLEPMRARPEAKKQVSRVGTVDMRDVSFGYGDEAMVRSVNLILKKGEMVGLYGPSGSGKSTVAGILVGLYRPWSGVVRVEGIDLSLIDVSTYQARVGVLTQSVSLFSGTIRENLTYGLEDISDDLLHRVCTLCGIQEYIDSLENGYDTSVGDRGAHLSGGQRQRVALARALMRQPDVLILDEPDNNLDTDTISGILDEIRARGIMTLVITHNQALKKHFDRMYECVKEDGVTTIQEQSTAS